MKFFVLFIALSAVTLSKGETSVPTGKKSPNSANTPCTCGVYLSGQFTKASADSPAVPPKGNPVLMHEHDAALLPCGPAGTKQCLNKCLDVLVKHLANSPALICGSMERDCHKERAYLFTKNCQDVWVNSNLSAGREYCCKNGTSYKCNAPPPT